MTGPSGKAPTTRVRRRISLNDPLLVRCGGLGTEIVSGCSTGMNPNLDLARIFQMDDEASARLMTVKAECLHSAGVINEAEKLAVLYRAKAVIENSRSSSTAMPSAFFARYVNSMIAT